MKLFWYILFGAQPWIFLLAILGVLGKEAEEAADEWGAAMGVLLLVILVVVAVFFLGSAVGLW